MWIKSLTLQQIALMIGLLMTSYAYASADAESMNTSDGQTSDVMSEMNMETAASPESSIVPTGVDAAIPNDLGNNVPAANNERPEPHYRPKIPKYHSDHPENDPIPPQKLRHPLVTHPELNTN